LQAKEKSEKTKPTSDPKTTGKRVSYGENTVTEISRVVDIAKVAAERVRKLNGASNMVSFNPPPEPPIAIPSSTSASGKATVSEYRNNSDVEDSMTAVSSTRAVIKSSNRRGPSPKRFVFPMESTIDDNIKCLTPAAVEAMTVENRKPFSPQKDFLKDPEGGAMVQRVLIKSNVRRIPSKKRFESADGDRPDTTVIEAISVPDIKVMPPKRTILIEGKLPDDNSAVDFRTKDPVRSGLNGGDKVDEIGTENVVLDFMSKQADLTGKESALKLADFELKHKKDIVTICETQLSELEQKIYAQKMDAEREMFEIDSEIIKMRKLISGISKRDVSDIWLSSTNPVASVRLTLEMICILIGEKPQPLPWESIKRTMRRDDFLSRISTLPTTFPPSITSKIKQQYLQNKDMSAAKVEKCNKLCTILRQWIVLLLR
jgi:hypothetical protein